MITELIAIIVLQNRPMMYCKHIIYVHNYIYELKNELNIILKPPYTSKEYAFK